MPRPEGSGSRMFPAYGISKRRREVIRRLAEAYSEDGLSLEDYEHRMHTAERATSIDELTAIVADFPDDRPAIRHAHADSGVRDPVPGSLHPAVRLVPAALLFLALLPFPYGFFVLLRLVVCCAAGLLTYHEYSLRGRVSGWTIVLACVVLLFNPIIPIHLTREIWAPINIVTGLLMVFHWRRRL